MPQSASANWLYKRGSAAQRGAWPQLHLSWERSPRKKTRQRHKSRRWIQEKTWYSGRSWDTQKRESIVLLLVAMTVGNWVRGSKACIWASRKICFVYGQTNPFFPSNFIFVGNQTRPIPIKQDLEFHFFWQHWPSHFPSHRICHFIFSEHRTCPISINADMHFPFFYNGSRISKQYCNSIQPHTQFFSSPHIRCFLWQHGQVAWGFFFGSFWQILWSRFSMANRMKGPVGLCVRLHACSKALCGSNSCFTKASFPE